METGTDPQSGRNGVLIPQSVNAINYVELIQQAISSDAFPCHRLSWETLNSLPHSVHLAQQIHDDLQSHFLRPAGIINFGDILARRCRPAIPKVFDSLPLQCQSIDTGDLLLISDDDRSSRMLQQLQWSAFSSVALTFKSAEEGKVCYFRREGYTARLQFMHLQQFMQRCGTVLLRKVIVTSDQREKLRVLLSQLSAERVESNSPFACSRFVAAIYRSVGLHTEAPEHFLPHTFAPDHDQTRGLQLDAPKIINPEVPSADFIYVGHAPDSKLINQHSHGSLEQVEKATCFLLERQNIVGLGFFVSSTCILTRYSFFHQREIQNMSVQIKSRVMRCEQLLHYSKDLDYALVNTAGSCDNHAELFFDEFALEAHPLGSKYRLLTSSDNMQHRPLPCVPVSLCLNGDIQFAPLEQGNFSTGGPLCNLDGNIIGLYTKPSTATSIDVILNDLNDNRALACVMTQLRRKLVISCLFKPILISIF